MIIKNGEAILGECLEAMKQLPDNSVDAIVTDPPYGLSFMGKKWDYDVPSVEIWQEALRVLKPGGYLLAFAGTRTQHRMAVRIEDAGFEIRDMIAWVYGSGFPKSLNIGKAVDKLQGNDREVIGKKDINAIKALQKFKEQDGRTVKTDFSNINIGITKGTSEWEGFGTALKPALEPITVARKPLSEKTVAENCLKWGVGGIDIDGSRVGTEERINKGMSSLGVMHDDNWKPQSVESTAIGRFPANLIHDGSDEVLECFPYTKSGLVKNTTNNFSGSNNINIGGGMLSPENSYGDSGSAARFFYCPKTSKSERNAGCESNGHPTIKPIALMEYLIKMVTKEQYTVLDPFMGSGSTILACENTNRKWIGIEMNEEYFEIGKNRISNNSLTLHIKK